MAPAVVLIHRNIVRTDPEGNKTDIYRCEVPAENNMSVIWYTMDTFIYAFIPSVLLLIGNIVIVRSGAKNRRMLVTIRERSDSTCRSVSSSGKLEAVEGENKGRNRSSGD